MNYPVAQGSTYKPDKSDLFEKMVASYERNLFHYVHNLIQDAELSADIVQETFLAIYARLAKGSKFKEVLNQSDFLKNLKPLIYTIARNKAVDEVRRRKLIRFVPFKPVAYSPESPHWQEDLDPAIEYMLTGPGSNLEAQIIMSDELKSAIEQIGRRKLINLFLHMDGYSYKEIGQITGDSMSSVKSKIFRCKQSLRQVLEKAG